MTSINGSTEAELAPRFARDLDLPEGWRWVCHEDGSGGLTAPDGTSYFEYDLAAAEMRDAHGMWGGIMGAFELRKVFEDVVLPDFDAKARPEFPDSRVYRAYGLNEGRALYINPSAYDRVAIAPGTSMGAREFNDMLQAAHRAEAANFSDKVTDAGEFARRLAGALPEPLRFEGEEFEITSLENAEARVDVLAGFLAQGGWDGPWRGSSSGRQAALDSTIARMKAYAGSAGLETTRSDHGPREAR